MEPLRPVDCLFAPQIPEMPKVASAAGSAPLPVPCLTRLANLVEQMDQFGIDRVLLTPCQVDPSRCDRQYLCDDALLSEFVQLVHTYPQRFSALAGYNPFDVSDSVRRMEEAVTKQAVRGFYVSSATLPLLDRRMYPAYAKCAELGVPIMIHADPGLAWAESWPMLEDIRTIATDLPELRAVAACVCWPGVSAARRMLEQQENIYLAVDANPRRDLAEEVSEFLNSELGRSRCVWGSNGCGWRTAIADLDKLKLSDQARARFTRENAVALFGLAEQNSPQIEVNFVLTGE